MPKNMGTVDRVFRVLLAAGIAGLYFAKVITGAVGLALLVLAGVFVLTSLVRTCPLYLPFGIRTDGKARR